MSQLETKIHNIKLNNYALYQCMAYAQKLDSVDPLFNILCYLNRSDLANRTAQLRVPVCFDISRYLTD